MKRRAAFPRLKREDVFAAECMDFSAWRRHYHISLAEVARITELPLAVVEQVEQGSCQTLAVAQRLRFKLYHFYDNPLMLNWIFFEGDPGGLPDWWWRFSWEEPNGVRVCVLVPEKSLNEAKGRFWLWMEKHRMPSPIHSELTELGELPETFPELFPHQPDGNPASSTEQWWRFFWEDPNRVRACVLIAAKQRSEAQHMYSQWKVPHRLPAFAEEQLTALGTLPPASSALYPGQPDYYRPFPIFDE